MAEITFNGKVHVFPDGFGLNEMAKVLQASVKTPEPPYVPPGVVPPAEKPLVEKIGPSFSWSNMQETPDQRRRAAAVSAAIMRQENKTTPGQTPQALIRQADSIASAADPFDAAKWTKYRKFLYGD